MSYFGTFRASALIHSIFFENPAYVGAVFTRFNFNRSKKISENFKLGENSFSSTDIIVSHDLALHNLALLEFFQNSLNFLISFHSIFSGKYSVGIFLNFYFRNQNLKIFQQFTGLALYSIDSKISKPIASRFSKLLEFTFLYRLTPKLPYDLLLSWVSTGLFFVDKLHLQIFYKSIRF